MIFFKIKSVVGFFVFLFTAIFVIACGPGKGLRSSEVPVTAEKSKPNNTNGNSGTTQSNVPIATPHVTSGSTSASTSHSSVGSTSGSGPTWAGTNLTGSMGGLAASSSTPQYTSSYSTLPPIYYYTSSGSLLNIDTYQPMYNEPGLPPAPYILDPVNIYRLYNPNNGDHLYTKDEAERNGIIAAGWNDEGIAFKTLQYVHISLAPLFRLYNPNAGLHYYTADLSERDSLIAQGWNLEPIQGYLSLTPIAGLVELFHIFHSSTGNHIFTTSISERDSLLTMANAPYQQHRSVGYVLP